jgi:DNA polymerase III epsilon subunit-like protein
MQDNSDLLISVDVETAGPYPGRFSMLAIGACLVADPTITFYAELQPLTPDVDPHALAISGLSMQGLLAHGLAPAEAMLQFAKWVQSACPPGSRPVFVGMNAAFDWMFVNDYFHRYLGYNPFGHSALDIKAFYAGRTGAQWSETSLRHIVARYGGAPALSHNALADAVDQAALMRALLAEQPPALNHPPAPGNGDAP